MQQKKRSRHPIRLTALFYSFDRKLLPSNDDFAKAIFCEKEAIVTELTQHIFNFSVVIDVNDRVVPCFLHLDDVGVGELVSTEMGIRV